MPDLREVPASSLGEHLVGHFLVRWEEDGTLVALLRAAVSQDAAVERITAIFAEQVGPVVARHAPDPGEVPARAGLVATQILGFALCRYVLRLPPVVALDREAAISWLAPTIQRYVTGAV
ncbi:hypothetical protein ACQP2E_18400 [Actinoplanes sp. CA-015351]|uniref:TetR/AcrR family transcriptional regulator n=1 Tax=Actinoplanes sp. CA-015351 TaxID=3239897 RepID=UPI003D98FA2B